MHSYQDKVHIDKSWGPVFPEKQNKTHFLGFASKYLDLALPPLFTYFGGVLLLLDS